MIDTELDGSSNQEWQNRKTSPERLTRIDDSLYSRYQVAGIDVICPVCGHNHFMRGHNMVNTRVLTFFRLDWLDGYAVTLRCFRCGNMLWFSQKNTLAEFILLLIILAGGGYIGLQIIQATAELVKSL